MNKRLTKVSDEERVVELYEKEGLGCEKIAEILHVSKNPVLRILRSKGKLRSSSERNQRYQRNSTYFREIDHERKAYWLGFLAADGNVHGNKLSFTLKANDREILETFLSDLKSNAPIRLVTQKNSGNSKLTTSARIKIGDKALTSDLKKWGVVERKTFVLKFPKIKEQFLRHFIRGYFDGDGCISKNTMQVSFSIVSANFDFITEVQKNLIQNCKLNKIKIGKYGSIYDLRYVGNLQGLRIYNYLYKDATRYLLRKKDKFEKILKINPNQLCLRF